MEQSPPGNRYDSGEFAMGIWLELGIFVVVLIFGTKKLRNVGQDLGGAVKGFKDGMKEGNTSEEKPATPVAAQQVQADKTTIDVEAKTKS